MEVKEQDESQHTFTLIIKTLHDMSNVIGVCTRYDMYTIISVIINYTCIYMGL